MKGPDDQSEMKVDHPVVNSEIKIDANGNIIMPGIAELSLPAVVEAEPQTTNIAPSTMPPKSAEPKPTKVAPQQQATQNPFVVTAQRPAPTIGRREMLSTPPPTAAAAQIDAPPTSQIKPSSIGGSSVTKTQGDAEFEFDQEKSAVDPMTKNDYINQHAKKVIQPLHDLNAQPVAATPSVDMSRSFNAAQKSVVNAQQPATSGANPFAPGGVRPQPFQAPSTPPPVF
jgi:hypothetical protein